MQYFNDGFLTDGKHNLDMRMPFDDDFMDLLRFLPGLNHGPTALALTNLPLVKTKNVFMFMNTFVHENSGPCFTDGFDGIGNVAGYVFLLFFCPTISLIDPLFCRKHVSSRQLACSVVNMFVHGAL